MRLTIDNGPVRFCSDWLIREPVQGAWRGQVVCDAAPEAVIGAALSINDGTWLGSVSRVRTDGALSVIELVGGKGKLGERTKARQYSGGTPRVSVLGELCEAAGETAGEATGQLGQWRSRGSQLVNELQRLSRAWRIAPNGTIVLEHSNAEVAAPGDFLKATGEASSYECPEPLPLAGNTFDGTTVEVALFARGRGRPTVTVWPMRTVIEPEQSIIAGTVTALSGGRADIELDNGEKLTSVPLFCAAGFVPDGAIAVRVLVLDCADDARNTIAITGVDGRIDALTLANAAEAGPLLRGGDKVMLTGLVSGTPGGPVTSPPMAVTIDLDPIYKVLPPGAPGVGPSRVKG